MDDPRDWWLPVLNFRFGWKPWEMQWLKPEELEAGVAFLKKQQDED